MNSRLESLISRGYPREVVMKLASFSDEELEYASRRAFEHISRNCSSVNNPIAIYIGGQPGCGKTVMSMNLKNEIKNAIEIGIDNYRMYHPNYLEIEKCIREHWEDKIETENDTPGNDIADFTHYFAGAMTDKLIELGMINNYNMLLEWGMREPSGPLKTMEKLKENGYSNIVLFVSANKERSYEACNLRSEVMKNSSRIIRKVPKNFHDICIKTLPASIDKIYMEGYDKKIINYMAIVTRGNEIIWDDKSKEMPGSIYNNYLNDENNYEYHPNSSSIAEHINNKEMVGLVNKLYDLKNIILLNPQIFEKTEKMQKK